MSLIATSKNSIITINSVLLSAPRILSGFSNENIIMIPNMEIVKSTMGNDGLISRAVVAKILTGSFHFFPASPSLSLIYDIQTAVYLSGVPFVGSLNVIFPSLATVFNFVDFSIESGPKGLEAADELKSVEIKWSSQLPNKSSLGSLATTIIGAL